MSGEVTPELVREWLDTGGPPPYMTLWTYRDIAAAYLQACGERDQLAAKIAAVQLAIQDANVNGLDDVTHEWAEGYFTALEKIEFVLGGSDV